MTMLVIGCFIIIMECGVQLSDGAGTRGLSCHWKQLAVVFVGCFTLFMYEFCER